MGRRAGATATNTYSSRDEHLKSRLFGDVANQ